MKTAEIISICALAISFFTFWLTFIRENRKKFQENLYDLKLNAYKSIIKEIWNYHEDVFILMQDMQDFEGDKDAWTIEIQKASPEYYDKAYKLRDLVSEHILLLPNNSIEKLHEIAQLAIGHVTNHYHFDSGAVISSHDRLFDMYNDFIDLARKDLGINKINKSLNKRLARDLYPIGFSNTVKS